MYSTQNYLKSLAALFCASLLLPAAAVAQPGRPIAPEHCGVLPPSPPFADDKFLEGPLPPFLHGLDLTESQRDAVFDILHAQAPMLRDRMKALRKGEEALRGLTLSMSYDEDKVRELLEENSENLAELTKLRIQGEHRIYTLLTAEQRKLVAERKSKGEFKPMNHCENKPQVGFKVL
ncbi:Spy/CpxP family protein refolding chaperone [Novimethylophilus kurashikiensis]|nr:Spy/CpxP family protein refolding chaperone [Novimethylophilus kurashikiensis]